MSLALTVSGLNISTPHLPVRTWDDAPLQVSTAMNLVVPICTNKVERVTVRGSQVLWQVLDLKKI